MITLLLVVVIFGFLLLIIPGVILAVRFTFAEFELLFKNNKPLDAMRCSWHATKDYFWVLFGGLMLLSLILYLPLNLVAAQFDITGLSYWVFDTSANIVYPVLNTLFTIFAFRVYEFANSAKP